MSVGKMVFGLKGEAPNFQHLLHFYIFDIQLKNSEKDKFSGTYILPSLEIVPIS
jgi:hypothetical protein